jgi:asparagine synthase (glutamine-hydrolysing)
MAHRGPDAEGFFIEGQAGLLHRRLSIIDLTGGRQPMFNEDKSLVLVFNGEIYNFKDLRHELQLRGHVFSTSSDSEVILHGFEEWGRECVQKFSGMFAFAIYNRRDSSLFLGRDRCGEKPIYYSNEGGKFIFASEIQALLAIRGQASNVDPHAVYLYLLLGYIPAPLSFYSGIKKLPAGSCLSFKEGRLGPWPYYTPCMLNEEIYSEQELCEILDSTLRQAVKKMLISDVPLGAFLSGGIDSSLIVAMMAKEIPELETFSISFDHNSFDESHYAQLVSEAIGTRHTKYTVSLGNLDDNLAIMSAFGEPFADSSSIPTYYLARETRKRVTVALSGDGSDEIFGGYRRYIAQGIADRYLLLPTLLRKTLASKFFALFPNKDVYYADSILKSAHIFTERAESLGIRPGLMLNTVFTHDEILSLFPDLPDGRIFIEDSIGYIPPKHKTEALMYADRIFYLPDDILVKVDRMTMQNSLEVRTPFLDPGVLDLSQHIPLSMKIRGRNQKYVLKKVALNYLPPHIVFRKKHGFVAPINKWINGLGQDEVQARMPVSAASIAIAKILQSQFHEGIDNSNKIFALMVLNQFFEKA